MDPRLAEAARSGSMEALYATIHEDPYVLENVEAVPFINTPFHVAAEHGNIAFAMEMMNLKPSFARKLDTNGLTPLHLALEHDQTKLALELVKVEPGLVRVRGREGMTPLHVVVRKGDVELLTEFLLACPECIRDVNVNGETALHIAVMNDRYEELEVLTGWVQRISQRDGQLLEIQVLNKRDKDGNTALHHAAFQDNHQAVKLLLQCPSVNRNIQNGNGMTALDILQTHREYMNRDVEKIMRKSGAMNAISLPRVKTTSEFLRSPITFSDYWSTHAARYKSQMPDGTRNALLIIAALIITTTFQTALQPPGGVRQDNGSNTNNVTRSRDVAGTVVMDGYYFPAIFGLNSLAFWSSVFTAFIVLPVGGEYVRWFLFVSVPMYFSYIVSMSVISPFPLAYLYASTLTLVGYVVGHYMVYFLSWKQSKLKKIPEPRSELILEGLTTLGMARGLEKSSVYFW